MNRCIPPDIRNRASGKIIIGYLLTGLLLPVNAFSRELSDNFRTAPEAVSEQTISAKIIINDVEAGYHDIKVNGDKIVLPHSTLSALRLEGLSHTDLSLKQGMEALIWKWDPKSGTLVLKVKPGVLGPLVLGATDDTVIRLSPETTGAWVNYDMNIRRSFGKGALPGKQALGFDAGGIAELNATAPDYGFYGAWSHDSGKTVGATTVRLDTYGLWRPEDKTLFAAVGDRISGANGQARPYRFAGIEIGTDYSARPGFNSNPLRQFSGTAAAQSSIDVYVDSQRVGGASTAGGNFRVALPATGTGTRVIVTDVSGKQVILPVEAPLVDARLIKEGLFLWSGGVGAPRFDYGSVSDSYDRDAYAYFNGRYGLTNSMTVTGHSEAGAGIFEAEAGLNTLVTPYLAVRTNAGGSTSSRGTGGFGSVGLILSGPWGLTADASFTKATGGYGDVVSDSGIRRAQHLHTPLYLILPSLGNTSGRVTWQAAPKLSFSASYSEYRYPVTGNTGFVSMNAQTTYWRDIPLFLTASKNVGGRENLSVLAGITLSFGRTTASLAAGAGTGGLNASVGAARSLDEEVGSTGWRALASRSGNTTFETAAAEHRTGYGIPGIQFDSFGGSSTAYLTGRGSFGYAGGHAFVGDPITGGLIIADTGAPDIPVTINGYSKGNTGRDGKLLVPATVAGTPQSVGVASERLPLDMVAEETQKTAVVRSGGATVLRFGVQDASGGAIITLTDRGRAPPAGSTLSGEGGSAPVDGRGRTYLGAIKPDEILLLTRPDGTQCTINTKFDGHGGSFRRIGPFECMEKTR